MYIAVTGAGGKIGRQIIPLMEEEGHVVTAMERGRHPSDIPLQGTDIMVHLASSGDLSADSGDDIKALCELSLASSWLASARSAKVAAVLLPSSHWITMNPELPYSKLKMGFEHLAQVWTRPGFRIVTDRVGYLPGEDECRDMLNPLLVSPRMLYRRWMYLLKHAQGGDNEK